jgi:glycerol-3-phosphate dehydrogenase
MSRSTWTEDWREKVWGSIHQPWDVVIIGGGITGAGILREASRLGLRSLLIEQKDFAWGTSSRSSKLVHGGFRYLKDGHIRLTLESVKEREHLVRQGRGLVNPLGFLMPSYRGDGMPPWIMGLGLTLYDLLAMKWSHRFYDAYDMKSFCPMIQETGLKGGYRFFDAQTDDARLVLRVIKEAVADGGVAVNYARAVDLMRSGVNHSVCGVIVEDCSLKRKLHGLSYKTAYYEVPAEIVINATGAWADDLRGGKRRLRRLRGSHLIFSRQRIPLTRAMSFWHPVDHRPVYILPWEGVTLVGTTDVDHLQPMNSEPWILQSEIDYLLESIRFIYPNLNIDQADIQATFAGIRPVVNTGKKDPSKESREHVLWLENGLLTVTGGKLTTFRPMAHQALIKARSFIKKSINPRKNVRVLNTARVDMSYPDPITGADRVRLLGRYGKDVQVIYTDYASSKFESIGGSVSTWAELCYTAKYEAVIHLDDLLLRRVRIGLQLPRGGLEYINQIKETVKDELNWDEKQWKEEIDRYAALWAECYHIPDLKKQTTSNLKTESSYKLDTMVS